jgi:hypothetical protein
VSPLEKCWVTGWACHRNLSLANCRLHLQGGHSNGACVPLAWPGGSALHPNAALHAPRPWALLPGHVLSKPNKSRPLQAVILSTASAACAADRALGVTRCAVPRVPASRHLNSPRLSVVPGELELGRTKRRRFPNVPSSSPMPCRASAHTAPSRSAPPIAQPATGHNWTHHIRIPRSRETRPLCPSSAARVLDAETRPPSCTETSRSLHCLPPT